MRKAPQATATKPAILPPVSFSPKMSGERGHNDDGATVIQQRGDTNADRLIGAEQENPAGAQRGARDDERCGLAGARRSLQVMALGYEEDGGKGESAQKRAQQYDIGARQCDSCGDDAVRAKQQ